MSLRRFLQLTVALVVATLALSLGSAAGAVDNPDYTAPPPSTPVTNPEPVQVRKITETAAVPARQWMPITGSDVTGMAVVGGLLVAGGAGLLVVRRRTAEA